MKFLKKYGVFSVLLITITAGAHPGHEGHEHEPGPKYVTLSDSDVKFVLEHKNEQLAYIPDIVCETFLLLKDLGEQDELSVELQGFIDCIEHTSRITSRSAALKAVFGALALLKKHESLLPHSYVDQLCDVLIGYQKSLHKEEFIVQENDCHR